MSTEDVLPVKSKQANRHAVRPARRSSPVLPVIIGADVELGAFIFGPDRLEGTGAEAARLLLREMTGFPREVKSYSCRCAACRANNNDGNDDGILSWHDPLSSTVRTGRAYNPQDWGRRYFISGGAAYLDMDHPEICLPEVRSAFDFIVVWHAALRMVEQARQAANAKLPSGQRLIVIANASDGHSHSWGAHMSFLVPRTWWDDVFLRKSLYLPYLASYQVSSMVFTGAGKVGSENHRPGVAYQLAQRADFYETLTGVQTTFHRPVVNSRDEPLCGDGQYAPSGDNPSQTMARLHAIFYDPNLCHVACLCKAGVMQLILAMTQRDQINPSLVLDDPVDAAVCFSHDPTLKARARMASGQRLTALELQSLFLGDAKQFVAAGGCDGLVPRAADILSLWEDVLVKLQRRDFGALSGSLDWVLKRTLLEDAMRNNPRLNWSSPEIKHLDHLYASVDPAEGLYWACERAGATRQLANSTEIQRRIHEPPEDTRAYTRGMLLKKAGLYADHVDWDVMRFKTWDDGYASRNWTLSLPDPTGFTRAQTASIFRDANSLDELLLALSQLDANRNEETHVEYA